VGEGCRGHVFCGDTRALDIEGVNSGRFGGLRSFRCDLV
jgi:hypothetical protein